MASSAAWVAKSLEKHTGVDHARVVRDDCVEISRKGSSPTVVVRVVSSQIDTSDLHQIGLDDVKAIVTLAKRGSYTWEAKVEARASGHDIYTNSELWRAINNKTFIGSETSDVQYFIDRISAHNKVRDLERLGPRSFRIHRWAGMESLVTYCADEYILSEDFVQQVLEEHLDAQIITNLSAWNKITSEAAEEATRRGSRVFDLAGMYGALNKDAKAIFNL